MVQDQLLDYISSQMKLGVSRDAIKSALVSAGWVAGDVEDTLKKLEGSGSAASAAAASAMQSTAKPMTTSSAMKSGEPQMIRVSDLVSKPAAVTTTVSAAKTDVSASKFGGKISGNSFEAASSSSSSVGSSASPAKSKMGLVMGIIAVIIILGLGGLAWYFYSGNASLATQVTSLTSSSADLTNQISSLQSQLNASTTGLESQMASLTAANADLALNLSFYAAPLTGDSSSTSTPAALPVTISGSLSGGGKVPYAITTPRGAKIFVSNSADAITSAELKPMIGHTVQASGTYVPGSDQMKVVSVTDLTPASAPAAATTTPSTATSTASSTPY